MAARRIILRPVPPHDEALADEFLRAVVIRLRAVPFTTMSAWPDYPSVPDFDLQAPAELSAYTFTLMKDSIDGGKVRVAVQRYRKRLLGVFGEMKVDGFVAASDGSIRELNHEEVWELT